jgi:hypothetical protein
MGEQFLLGIRIGLDICQLLRISRRNGFSANCIGYTSSVTIRKRSSNSTSVNNLRSKGIIFKTISGSSEEE